MGGTILARCQIGLIKQEGIVMNNLTKLYQDLNIVVFDIEILARADDLMAKYFGAYEGFGMGADISDIISFGYKRLGQDTKAHTINKWDFTDPTDKTLCFAMYEILKDAHLIVTFYGTKFDRRFINARLAKWGLFLDPYIKHVDVHSVCRKHFKMSRKSLNNMLHFFGLPLKMDHGQGQQLWYDVYKGSTQAQSTMAAYCAQDVDALHTLFEHLIPIIPMPNPRGTNDRSCPKCGGIEVYRNGTRASVGGLMQRFKCANCGTSFSKTKTNLTREVTR